MMAPKLFIIAAFALPANALRLPIPSSTDFTIQHSMDDADEMLYESDVMKYLTDADQFGEPPIFDSVLPDLPTARYNKIPYFETQDFSSLQGKTIFFLGDSIDRYSVFDDFCGGLSKKDMNGLRGFFGYCKTEELTLFYHLLVGSRPKFINEETTRKAFPSECALGALDSVENWFKYVVYPNAKANNATEPDLIVLNSNLWDVTRMVRDKTTSEAALQAWCHEDMPNLYSIVQKLFPRSKIILRTQPQVMAKSKHPSVANPALEYMAKCAKKEFMAPEAWKTRNKIDVIDYHSIFKENFDKVRRQYRDDKYHPSPEMNRLYMNEVLNYAAMDFQNPALDGRRLWNQ